MMGTVTSDERLPGHGPHRPSDAKRQLAKETMNKSILELTFAATVIAAPTTVFAQGTRCSTDSLGVAQAMARLEWARKCSLTLNTAGPNSTFTSARGAFISGGTLVGAPDYLENTTSKAYTGNSNFHEINYSYGFSLYTGSIYTVAQDSSGPTLGFWRWSQPVTNRRGQPLYPIFDSNSPSGTGIQLFPNSTLLDTTSPTRWQTVDCNLYQKDPVTGALTQWTGNFYVSSYCASTCHAPNGTFTSTDVPKSIPDNNATGITSTKSISGEGNVGSLTLSLNITHTFIGDLVVTLISPEGTPFIVSNRQGDATANLVINNLPISAFNGHAAAGTWKLKVQDLEAVDVGTLNSWSLTIAGNCNPVVNWSGSATPNIATVDNGTVCTSVNVPTTGGDSSLAKLAISGHHDFCAVLRGTLTHNGVTVQAFPTDTFPADVCDFSLASLGVPGLSGSSSGTWTLCITDTDAFGDTGVLNTWAVHN
jgi:subtilisin-like proprotein convertase family protein